ncbi:hypothetical protein M1D72_21590 [Vibrio sp. AK197]|uniref:Uncharacterized protein n=1 Tax=Vibrio olivae TaxID=1243002 RepID=A0ABV5HT21_9VIBR
MLTVLDRLTIYSVLCLVCFGALFVVPASGWSFLPLVGMAATIVGIWLEVFCWSEMSEEQEP